MDPQDVGCYDGSPSLNDYEQVDGICNIGK